MPELPEVAAHATRLDSSFVGQRLVRFDALSFTALKTADVDPARAYGSAVTSITSRAKYLILSFGGISFIVHLMQGGRLTPDDKLSAKPRGALARWRFEDGPALLLSEMSKERKAGVWVVDGDPLTASVFEGLAPDADTVDLSWLSEHLGQHSGRVHGWLRQQRSIAGIGRRLANEICHAAGISPFANTSKLSHDEVAALSVAIETCIADSMAFESSQDHMVSSKDRPAMVHHRKGEPCPRCGDVIREVSYNAYDVDYCATCQTNGKVLADNTTSKFLK